MGGTPRRRTSQRAVVILSAMNFARDLVDAADPAASRSSSSAVTGAGASGVSARSHAAARALAGGSRATAFGAATWS